MAFSILDSARRQIERISSDTVRRTVKDVGLGYVSPIEQPQLAYMWEVSFNGIFASQGKNLQFYAQNTALPIMSTEPVTRYYAGKAYSWAGKENAGKILRVTFWDNQSLDVYRFFQDWIRTTNDFETSRKVNPMNYKRDITLRLKDTSDLLINGEFIFEGCFPTEVSDVGLIYQESQVMTFDVIFKFDGKKTSGEASSIIESGINLAGNIVSNVVSTAIEGIRNWF